MNQPKDTTGRERRFHISLSDAELAAIDDWRFANRIATRADAVRRLIFASIGHPSDVSREADPS